MELHDIRYLHDDSLPEDEDLGGDFVLTKFFTKKNVISTGIICILLVSLIAVTINISQRTTTQSSASEDASGVISSEPTVAPVKVTGKVVCIPGETAQKDQCNLGLKTTDGSTYSLQDIQYEDVVSGALTPGNKVTVVGSVVANGSSPSGSGGSSGSSVDGSLFLSNPDGSGAVQQGSTPTPTASPLSTPTPFPTPTITITPTPNVAPVS